MGLKLRRFFFSLAVTVSLASVLSAAPKLRLTSAAVGPVTVAQGSNAPGQSVEAYNIGDGALSLAVTSSATWLSGSVGGATACTKRTGSCLPLNFALNTSSLSAGSYTAIATVADPNAVDAPQTVTVTVQVGGGVPNSIDIYAPPGGGGDASFVTNSQLNLKTATSDGRSWLTASLDGTGSFLFVYPYRVHAAPLAAQGEGSYTGTVTTSGSNFAGDNKTIPVTMRVTSQPILQVQSDSKPVATVSASGIRVQLAQGAPRYDLSVILNNLGQGTLTVSSAALTGGDWLVVTTAPPAYVIASFDASKVTGPGSYDGTLTVNTNAANGNLKIPVQFVVAAKSAPVVRFQGVVDNAVFAPGDAVSRGSILAVIGDQLSFASATAGKAPPLDTTIGGARVLVNGQPAPMYYSTYGQLAFQMPFDVAGSTAEVTVERDGQRSNTVTVDVVDRAPRVLRIGIGDYGAIVNSQDGSLPFLSTVQVPTWSVHPAHRGDTLTIYAIGLGPTSPSVAAGQAGPAAEPLARLASPAVVNFGGGPTAAKATPLFAGLNSNAAGLYQVNVVIPPEAPKGIVAVSLGFADALSNIVQIAIE